MGKGRRDKGRRRRGRRRDLKVSLTMMAGHVSYFGSAELIRRDVLFFAGKCGRVY